MKRANAYDNYKQALMRKKNEELSLKITEKANNQIISMLDNRKHISKTQNLLIQWNKEMVGNIYDSVKEGKVTMETFFKFKRMWNEEMENIVGKEDKFLIDLMK